MLRCSQIVLVQVCLALAGALGAGFSGVMHARTGSHGGHHARHTRGNANRNARCGGRDTQGDHWHEVDGLKPAAAVSADAGNPDASSVAVLPAVASPVPQFVQTAVASVPLTGFVPSTRALRLPSRAPPALS